MGSDELREEFLKLDREMITAMRERARMKHLSAQTRGCLRAILRLDLPDAEVGAELAEVAYEIDDLLRRLRPDIHDHRVQRALPVQHSELIN